MLPLTYYFIYWKSLFSVALDGRNLIYILPIANRAAPQPHKHTQQWGGESRERGYIQTHDQSYSITVLFQAKTPLQVSLMYRHKHNQQDRIAHNESVMLLHELYSLSSTINCLAYNENEHVVNKEHMRLVPIYSCPLIVYKMVCVFTTVSRQRLFYHPNAMRLALKLTTIFIISHN